MHEPDGPMCDVCGILASELDVPSSKFMGRHRRIEGTATRMCEFARRVRNLDVAQKAASKAVPHGLVGMHGQENCVCGSDLIMWTRGRIEKTVCRASGKVLREGLKGSSDPPMPYVDDGGAIAVARRYDR